MADSGEKGQPDTRTPGVSASSGAPGRSIAGPGDGAGALPGADPDALLSGLPEHVAGDLLEAVAELTNAERRGRGRPAGSPNRKTSDLVKLLEARGFRDPAVTLSLIHSMSFTAACELVGAHKSKERIAVLGIIKSAAEAMLPYHHAKQPTQLDLTDPTGKRPLLVIGEAQNVLIAGGEAFVSAGLAPPEKTVEHQALSDGEAVRLDGA